VVYDAVVLATGSDEKAGRLRSELDEMAIAEGKARNRNQGEFALEVFGQSIRETNCDCDRSDDPSLLQSIYLRNDAEMYKRLADKDGWVAQACRTLGVEGPSAEDSPKQAAAKRAAENLKRQLIQRLVQFNKIPEDRRDRSVARIKRDYHRIKSKFKQYGFVVPPLQRLLDDPRSWTELESGEETVSAEISLDQLVEEAYLRTLSRFPENDELEIAVDFIEQSETPADGVQSLLWALVNTKEFIISH
jgi:hypothetical protein